MDQPYFAKESFHYTGRIHEQVTAYDEKEYRTYEAPVLIGHTGYDLPKKEKKAKALRNIRLLEQELKNSGWDAKVHATQLEQNLSKQDTDAEQKSEIADAKKSSRSRIYYTSLEKAITWQKIMTRHASGLPMV